MDGATVINYYTEFCITPAAEVDFDLDNASPASGVWRHADAGYETAIQYAKDHGLQLPGILGN